MREQGEEPVASSSPSSSSKRRKSISDPNPISSLESEEVQCGICLTCSTRSIKGKIDGCDHDFCFVCVMEWGRIDSRCPLCRKRFGSVTRPVTPGLFESERIVKISERNQVYRPFAVDTPITEPNPNTNCTICKCRGNEKLLILCNLCNLASHTYCTGTGTVPVKDWYCPDCTICKANQLSRETPLDGLDKIRALKNEYSNENLKNIYDFIGTEKLASNADGAPSNNKWLAYRINCIRANWGLIRSGDLDFEDGFKNPNLGDENVSSENLVERSRKRDVSKAWKMFKKAKPVFKAKKAFEKTTVNSTNHSLNIGIKKPVFEQNVGIRKPFFGENVGIRKLVFDQNVGIRKAVFDENVGIKKPFFDQNVGIRKPVFDQNVGIKKPVFGQDVGIKKPGFGQNVGIRKPVFDQKSQPNYNSMSSDKLWKNQNGSSFENSSGTKFGLLDRKLREDSAKSEIQTLVKQNLKMFGDKLGVDRFKKIARVSTHSILAACGFNHSESDFRYFSKLPCYHNEAIKSDLMQDYCKQCFNYFVHEVVKSVLSE